MRRNNQQAAGSWQLAASRLAAPGLRDLVVCLLPAACCLLLLLGCQQQMAETGREKPLDHTAFFEDQRVARPLVPGTVARGQLRADAALYTGKVGETLVAQLPIPLTKDLLERGRERFDIFCAACHGRLGTGEGAVARRGMRLPPSYHTQRLREVPIGYFFDVVTNGFGVMPDYAAQVPPADRWAIAAYIRVLQVSQNIPVAELTAEDRTQLDQKK